jgi:transcription antitermination factor NusG
MGMMDEAWRESVRRTPEEEKNMTATLTVGELEIMKEDMKQLTKSYYDALSRIKELVEKVEELKNEVESLKGDKVELRSIRGH